LSEGTPVRVERVDELPVESEDAVAYFDASTLTLYALREADDELIVSYVSELSRRVYESERQADGDPFDGYGQVALHDGMERIHQMLLGRESAPPPSSQERPQVHVNVPPQQQPHVEVHVPSLQPQPITLEVTAPEPRQIEPFVEKPHEVSKTFERDDDGRMTGMAVSLSDGTEKKYIVDTDDDGIIRSIKEEETDGEG